MTLPESLLAIDDETDKEEVLVRVDERATQSNVGILVSCVGAHGSNVSHPSSADSVSDAYGG